MTGEVPPTSPDLVIAGPLPCIACGYDLDTRAIGTPRPECGSSTSLSMESLWLDDPLYLEQLRRGLKWMSIAAAIGPAVFALSILASLILPEPPVSADFFWGIVALSLGAGPAVAWRGVSVFARPRPMQPELNADICKAARNVAAGYAAAFGFAMLLSLIRSSGAGRPDEDLLIGALLIAGELWCVRNLLLLAHIRALARAANMPRIARIAPALQVLGGILAVAGGGMGLIMLGGMRGGPRSAAVVAYVVVVGGVVLWIVAWPIYLGRLSRGLRAMSRQMNQRGRPRLISPQRAASEREEHP